MLIPRQAESETAARHGGPHATFAELRRRLAEPSKIDDGHRQRLLELARRSARIQALGDEFARVEVSRFVTAALGHDAAVA